MLRMPKTNNSTATLLETGGRVRRLCDQAGAIGTKYAESITGAQEELKSSAEQVELKTSERIGNYDAMVLAEDELDEKVRSLFYTCRKYDLHSETDTVTDKVFPESILSPVLYTSRTDKLEQVARVLARLSTVTSKGSPLTAGKKELETALQRSREAQQRYDASVLEENNCKALELLVKEAFVERYRAVYFTACGELGRKRAYKLFPHTRKNHKDSDTPEAAPQDSVSAAA